jgi:hypothetical protein
MASLSVRHPVTAARHLVTNRQWMSAFALSRSPTFN